MKVVATLIVLTFNGLFQSSCGERVVKGG